MNRYDLALFLHLLALLAAIAASTIVHVSMSKVRSARTGGEALQWLGLAHAFARVFPIALAALLGTGAWMVHDRWPWGAGFVEAGLTGVVFLAVSGGVVEGGRARRVATALAARPGESLEHAAALVRDPLWWCASWGNTGVALAVVLSMVAKPSPAASFSVLAVGLTAGCCVGLASRRRAPVPNESVYEGLAR
jgi:hypothetical protein